MFPTPPSLEHPSPADGTMEVDHGTLKMEPFSPAPDLTDWWTGGEDFDYTLSSSKFAPLKRLYSDGLPALHTPAEFRYKPQRVQPRGPGQPPNAGTAASMIKIYQLNHFVYKELPFDILHAYLESNMRVFQESGSSKKKTLKKPLPMLEWQADWSKSSL